MKPPFTFRPRARLDLLEQFLYLSDQATTEVAERYFTAVEPHAGSIDIVRILHGARDIQHLFTNEEA